eukprot:m51a1_g3978 hypothetical protein (282) ;mRNA; r:439279-440216
MSSALTEAPASAPAELADTKDAKKRPGPDEVCIPEAPEAPEAKRPRESGQSAPEKRSGSGRPSRQGRRERRKSPRPPRPVPQAPGPNDVVFAVDFECFEVTKVDATPCEVALTAFTPSGGEIAFFHRLINPGYVHMSLSVHFAIKCHGIHPGALASQAPVDRAALLAEMLAFVERHRGSGPLPGPALVYAKAPDCEVKCLRWLLRGTQRDVAELPLAVTDIERGVGALDGVRVAEVYGAAARRVAGARCPFHEPRPPKHHCALADSRAVQAVLREACDGSL